MERGLERTLGQPAGKGRQRLQCGSIHRICKRFPRWCGFGANLHAHPDSSKFPSLTLQGSQQFGATLPYDGSNGAGVGGKFQLSISLFRDPNAERQGARKMSAHDTREHFLAIATGGPFGQRRVGAEDALKRLRGTHDGGKGLRPSHRRRA